jgi:hypothetical protein
MVPTSTWALAFPADEDRDLDLMNAGKKYVTALPGAAYFHHADSFSMIRGGHIDVCVLGTMQVAANGDIANWSTGAPDAIPAVGGAMDLVQGVKQIFVGGWGNGPGAGCETDLCDYAAYDQNRRSEARREVYLPANRAWCRVTYFHRPCRR